MVFPVDPILYILLGVARQQVFAQLVEPPHTGTFPAGPQDNVLEVPDQGGHLVDTGLVQGDLLLLLVLDLADEDGPGLLPLARQVLAEDGVPGFQGVGAQGVDGVLELVLGAERPLLLREVVVEVEQEAHQLGRVPQPGVL